LHFFLLLLILFSDENNLSSWETLKEGDEGVSGELIQGRLSFYRFQMDEACVGFKVKVACDYGQTDLFISTTYPEPSQSKSLLFPSCLLSLLSLTLLIIPLPLLALQTTSIGPRTVHIPKVTLNT
jgi:hypothetical protein